MKNEKNSADQGFLVFYKLVVLAQVESGAVLKKEKHKHMYKVGCAGMLMKKLGYISTILYQAPHKNVPRQTRSIKCLPANDAASAA